MHSLRVQVRACITCKNGQFPSLTLLTCVTGTGGTLAGVSCYLKARKPNLTVVLADPQGSSLYNKVTRGVLYTREEAEGKRLRNQNVSIWC